MKMKSNKSNHDLGECVMCAWNRGQGYDLCKVFVDKRNVILDENGKCNAIATEAEKEKIEKECKNYSLRAWGLMA